MRSQISRLSIAITGTFGAALLAFAPSAAAKPLPTPTDQPVFSCTSSSMDTPHFSSGAGSVITKVRVYCKGDPGTVKIQVSVGNMYSIGSGVSHGAPAQGPGTLRYSGYSGEQWVQINSTTPKTFYVPAVGAPKLTLNATWYGSAQLLWNNPEPYDHGERLNVEYSPYNYTGPSCP